jgi:hypothetical protein
MIASSAAADPMAQRFRLLELMRGDQHTPAILSHGPDHIPDPMAGLEVEADGRLIQDQEVGLVQHRDRDVEPPSHAAAQERDDRVCPILEPDVAETRGHAPRAPRTIQLIQGREELEVLLAREIAIQRHVLAGHTHPGVCIGSDGPTVQRHGPRVGRDDGTRNVDQGGLARTVRPNEPVDLPTVDRKAQLRQHTPLTERLADAVDPEHRGHHSTRSRCSMTR